MSLPDGQKWQLLCTSLDDIKSRPNYWISLLNLEPTGENLHALSILLRSEADAWLTEFIELSGANPPRLSHTQTRAHTTAPSRPIPVPIS